MRQLILIIAVIFLMLNISGCSQGDKSKILEKYKYDESIGVPTELVRNKIGVWVKEGVICYGIVVVHDESGKPVRVREVRAKVISIEPNKIRMRSLENITMAQVKGCNKYSITVGEDWDELEGDLFQTKEEAIKFIDAKYPGLRMK